MVIYIYRAGLGTYKGKVVSLEPERTEDLQGTGLQTLPRTQLAGEDHREGTTDCKLTEDKRTYRGQTLSLLRARPGVELLGSCMKTSIDVAINHL